MKRKQPVKQRGICCPCGRTEILALGLCASCYSMKRQDEENYGGLREVVLDRTSGGAAPVPTWRGANYASIIESLAYPSWS
ncbi:hypothetical protein [Acidisarcina polymorpha]|nr:hypothetical protein [Acidisarcina polymorpha]